eukprot:scaffold24456_cov94-Skeletonema_dohrnii-CCMP3373.AAC.1
MFKLCNNVLPASIVAGAGGSPDLLYLLLEATQAAAHDVDVKQFVMGKIPSFQFASDATVEVDGCDKGITSCEEDEDKAKESVFGRLIEFNKSTYSYTTAGSYRWLEE